MSIGHFGRFPKVLVFLAKLVLMNTTIAYTKKLIFSRVSQEEINVIRMLQKSMTRNSDPPAPLCNEFRFLNNIELYERSLIDLCRY